MTSRRIVRILATVSLALGLAAVAPQARAQQLIIKGMYGMMSGTQAPPGVYAGMFGAVSFADEIRGPNGNSVKGPDLTQEIFGPLVQYVSTFKILGGNYGAVVAVPFANVLIDSPRLDAGGASTGLALSQLYVSPVQIGWHSDQKLLIFAGGVDTVAAYTFYAPTGRYTPGALNNTSLGMWCNELSVRSTGFLDKQKQWHAAGAVFYDINSKKEDVDWKQGNAINFMGGFGRNWCVPNSKLGGWAGIAGYAQWQVSDTTGADAPLLLRNNKSIIYGIGPELTALQGALTVRYLWQYGGKTTVQGSGLYVQFAMPLPF